MEYVNFVNFNELCRKIQENLFKVIVIGDVGVGKTAFVKQACVGKFFPDCGVTIGLDFMCKRFEMNKKIVRLQLWDIAGQERMGNMTRLYYKDAIGAVIMYDSTREQTFEAVRFWKKDLDDKLRLPDGSIVPCILLANKCDTTAKDGKTTENENLKKYAQDNGFVCCYEVSVMNNINVNESLIKLTGEMMKKKNLFPYVEYPKPGDRERVFNLSQTVDHVEMSVNREVSRSLRGGWRSNCLCV